MVRQTMPIIEQQQGTRAGVVHGAIGAIDERPIQRQPEHRADTANAHELRHGAVSRVKLNNPRRTTILEIVPLNVGKNPIVSRKTPIVTQADIGGKGVATPRPVAGNPTTVTKPTTIPRSNRPLEPIGHRIGRPIERIPPYEPQLIDMEGMDRDIGGSTPRH